VQLVEDTWIIFRSEFETSWRNRVAVIIGLVQPLLYLALFGPMLTHILPGKPADAWLVFIPGLLVQLGLFATGYAGFGLIPDLRSGVMERLRVTPVNRLALLLGRVLRDAVVLLVQSLALILLGFAFGLRAPFVGILADLLFLLFVGMSLAAVSYAIAMALPGEYLFAPVVNSVALPLMLLSGILLPMNYAPDWLRYVSYANPLRYIVDGMRAAMAGEFTDRALVVGLLVAVGLAVVTVSLGTRRFVRHTA
jgi:ABC-2 type transport system permease protein